MTIERIRRLIASNGGTGVRRSPRSAEDDGRVAPLVEGLRGDHDLNPDFYDPDKALTPAAVLVPIVERRPDPTILLTRRTDHLYAHAGQVSFPGGQIEAADPTPEAAALREAEEEIGLAPERVRPIGRLDTYVTRTGFTVTPVVGLVAPPFDLTADRFEVAEIFEVPLPFFLVPENRRRHSRMFQGQERHFFAFDYEGHFIWGATAGMLVNLIEVLGAGRA